MAPLSSPCSSCAAESSAEKSCSNAAAGSTHALYCLPRIVPPPAGGNAADFQLLQEAAQQLLPVGNPGAHTATAQRKVTPPAGSLLAGGRCPVCGGRPAATHGSGITAGNVWAEVPGTRGAAGTPWWDSTASKASTGLPEVGHKERWVRVQAPSHEIMAPAWIVLTRTERPDVGVCMCAQHSAHGAAGVAATRGRRPSRPGRR